MLDQNILEVDPAEIHNTTVLLTYFEGSEVDRSQAYAEAGPACSAAAAR